MIIFLYSSKFKIDALLPGDYSLQNVLWVSVTPLGS